MDDLLNTRARKRERERDRQRERERGRSGSTGGEWWEESRGESKTGEGASGDEGRRRKNRDVDGRRRTENACQLDNSTSTSRPWLPPPGTLSPLRSSRTLRPRTRRRSKGKGERAWVTRRGNTKLFQGERRSIRARIEGHRWWPRLAGSVSSATRWRKSRGGWSFFSFRTT